MNYPGGGMPGEPNGPSGVTKIGNLTYNVAGLLCYLPLFGINFISSILWLITEPRESKFVRFHAIQSLTMMAAMVLVVFSLMCCSGVSIPLLGSIGGDDAAPIAGILVLVLSLVQIGVFLGYFVLHVWLMVKAYGNEMWKIPVVGNVAASQS